MGNWLRRLGTWVGVLLLVLVGFGYFAFRFVAKSGGGIDVPIGYPTGTPNVKPDPSWSSPELAGGDRYKTEKSRSGVFVPIGEMVEAQSDGVRLTGCASEPHTIPLYWNTWTTLATDPATGSPSEILEPDRVYYLYLDLSALDYRLAFNEGGDAFEVDPRVRATLATTGSVRFDVVVLPDDNVFGRVEDSEWESSLQVPITRLCNYHGERQPPPYSLPDVDPSYRFAHVKFKLRTRATVPAGTVGAIGISIWANGRPVDDLEVHRCIGGPCRRPDPLGQPAVAALAAAGANETAPDVGLHVLAVGNHSTWSVLRLRGESVRNAVKWRLGDRSSLVAALNATLHALNGIGSQGLPQLGTGLLNILFPPQQDAAIAARNRFAALMHQLHEGQPRPLLVAKFVPTLPLPLGLAALRESSGQATFLGRAFDIELPLDITTPTRPRSDQCQLSWISLRPPAGTAVEDDTLHWLRDRLDGYNDRLLRLWRMQRPDASFFDVQSFGQWIGQYPSSSDDRGPRSGLMIVSHHGTPDEIHFAPDGADQLTPSVFARNFVAPSIAILNACGTGNPTAMGFVQRLVEEGFTSIIATACEVNWDLAADFLHCFAASVDRHATAMPVGDVFNEAITCLRDDMHYGDRAYAYMLLGDPTALVCPIRPEELRP